MDMLYGNQRKFLKIVYKNYKSNKLVTKTELSKILKLDYKQVGQICKHLYDCDYISYVGLDYNPKITSKGIDYFSAESEEWVSKNLIAILALAISILAFIRTL